VIDSPEGDCYIPNGMKPAKPWGHMAKTPAKRRSREPDVTRDKLLLAAFEEIYRRGFQAASLDAILAKAGVTKGALYHHFPDKAALGYAVVDDVIKGLLLERWLGLLDPTGDPLSALQRVLQRRAASLTVQEVELGCPLNNMAQEMSPLDERFRRRISATFDAWRDGFAQALERGQAEGSVRQDVDARKVATFMVAAVEGSFGLAKSANSAPMLRSNLEVLSGFLDGLRPAPRDRRRTRAARTRSRHVG
jgi:TetR/AcrR family transcriptional repressor of nem operon